MKIARGLLKKTGVTLAIGFLLALVALPNGRDTLFQGANLDSSAQEVITVVGGADSGNYLRGGLDVKDDGRIGQEQAWLINLWPPGMFYTYGIVFQLGGEDVRIVQVVLAISLLIWTVLLGWIYRVIKRQTNSLCGVGTVLAIIIFGWPSHGLFSDQLLGSDGVSFALFIVALLIFLKVDFNRLAQCARWGVAIGFLIAAAAYYRVSYELMGLALSFGTIILLIVKLALTLTYSKFRSRKVRSWGLLVLLLSVCSSFHLATVPWRLIAAENIRPGNYVWSTAGSFYWDQRWMPNSVFKDFGIEWLSAGGANSACRIDPQKCAEIYQHEFSTTAPYQGGGYSQSEFKSLALETYRSKPLQLVSDRIQVFLNSWFGFGMSRSPEILLGQILTFVAFLLVVTEAFLALLTRKEARRGGAFLTIVACYLAPFLVMHIEYRYLEPVKFLSLVFLPTSILNLLILRQHTGLNLKLQPSTCVKELSDGGAE